MIMLGINQVSSLALCSSGISLEAVINEERYLHGSRLYNYIHAGCYELCVTSYSYGDRKEK